MSFDAIGAPRQRIAVIGGGVSGLAAAYRLSSRHQVTLYEAEPRLGGHARTVVAGLRGDQPVDTGFIVFNYANYPHLTAMFDHLNVPVAKSDMSFGATIDNGKVEYALTSLSALLGQRRNVVRPEFLRMVRDIMRFNARCEDAARDTRMTIGDLVSHLRLGRWFEQYYLMPICGAIWSTPTAGIREFPAQALVRFFRNHALLNVTGQHQWWTVDGGSIEYVRRLEAYLARQGCDLRPGTPVRAVRRDSEGATIVTQGGEERFDQVILASHSDQALRLLADPSRDETRILSRLRYQDNHAVLHRDTNQMPRRKICWSAWVYQADSTIEQGQIGVTYWMNKLQNIPAEDPLFVTLNAARAIPDELIYDEKTFRHPVFDGPALAAQEELTTIQGAQNTWFAGAWTGNGFHEDGFASAVAVADKLEGQFV